MELTKSIPVQVLHGCCAAFRSMWNRECQVKEPLLVVPAAEDHPCCWKPCLDGTRAAGRSHTIQGTTAPHNNDLPTGTSNLLGQLILLLLVIILGVPPDKWWNAPILDFHSMTNLSHLVSTGNWWVHHLPVCYYYYLNFYYFFKHHWQ